mmetsp:Transcript_9739/g.13685  ORF Transcript_9739/g.13685 Transcript_9739/m.13685 type:complete len:122 (-) Transcript_9739:137-502(-)
MELELKNGMSNANISRPKANKQTSLTKFFGVVTAIYGLYLSLKLNRVRKAILESKQQPKCRTTGLNKEEFGNICHSHGNVSFSEQQLGFVMSSLSFEPGDGSAISPEEFSHWLEPGRMQLV